MLYFFKKTKMFRSFVFIFSLFSCALFAKQEALTFSIQIAEHKTNEFLLKELQQRLALAFGEPVQHLLRSNGELDVIVTTLDRDISDYVSVEYPVKHLAELIKITNTNADELAPTVVIDNVFAPQLDDAIKVARVEDATRLLSRNKAKSVVDHKHNQVVYQYLDKGYTIDAFKSQALLKIHFKSSRLKELFVSKVVMDDEQDDLSKVNNESQINFVRIYKFFESSQKTFQPLESEMALLQWLNHQYFPELSFEYSDSNFKGAMERVSENENVCILNVLKTPERAKVAHYSAPTSSFLSKFLYVKPDTPTDKVLASLNHMSLPSILNAMPNLLIGYWRRNSRELSGFGLSESQIKNNFMNLSFSDSLEKVNYNLPGQMDFLAKDRVEAVLEFPFTVNELFVRGIKVGGYKAYPIKSDSTKTLSHIACSKSDKGQNFINKLDKLLQSEVFRKAFIKKLHPNYGEYEMQLALEELNEEY